MTRSATAQVVTSLFLERIVGGLYQGLGRDLPQPLVILIWSQVLVRDDPW